MSAFETTDIASMTDMIHDSRERDCSGRNYHLRNKICKMVEFQGGYDGVPSGLTRKQVRAIEALCQPKGEFTFAPGISARLAKLERSRVKRGRFELQGIDEVQQSIMAFFPGLKAKDSKTVSLIEDILLASVQLFRARDKMDIFLAVCVFIKTRTQESLLSSTLTAFAKFYNTIFSDAKDETREMELQAEPEDGFSMLKSVNDFRDVLANWEELKNTTIGVKLFKVIRYMMAYGLFTAVGVPPTRGVYSRLESITVGPIEHGNFVYCVVDFASFTLQRILMYAKTGDWNTFLHGPKTYADWYDSCLELKRTAHSLGNLEAQGTNYFKFVHDLKECIERGKAIVKYSCKDNNGEFRAARQLLNELMIIEANVLTQKSAQQERRAPLGVLVYGGSSVAKSMFCKMLFYYYAKIMNLPMEDEYKYTRNAADPYWSGFTSQKWALFLDDIALLYAGKATEDLSLTELIAIVNNVPLVPNQAALEDKGRTPLRCKLVVATTNTKDLNATEYFSCPLAVQRRLPVVITIAPKREFARSDAPDMIDPLKMTPLDGDWPDYWDIVVEKVVPAGKIGGGRTIAKHEVINVFSDVNLFLDWFRSFVMEFELIQQRAMAGDTTMKNLELCLACNRPKDRCECDQAIQGRNQVELPEGVNWGENFSMNEVEDELVFQDHFSYTGEGYIVTKQTYKSGRLIRNVVSRCQVVQHGAKEEVVEEKTAELADLLDEILRRQRVQLQGRDRILSRVVGGAMSAYVRYKPVRWCADSLLEFAFVRSIVCWVMVTHMEQGSHFRAAIKMVGDLRQRAYANRGWLATIGVLSLVASAALAYAYFQPKKKQQTPDLPVQGLRQSVPDSHFARTDKENVWKRDDYVPNSFDLTPKMLNYAALEHDAVVDIVSRNCARLIVRANGLTIPGNAFCVSGRLWVTNNHLLPKCDEGIVVRMMFGPDACGTSPNFSVTLHECDLLRVPEKDMVWFECSAASVRKDLSELLPNASYNVNTRAYYVGYDRQCKMRSKVVKACHRDYGHCEQLGADMEYWAGSVDEDTVNGDCGTILIHTSPVTSILGLHQMGGSRQQTFAVSLCREDYNDARNRFNRPVVQSGVPRISAPSAPKILGPLRQKAPVRWLQEGTLECFGSFQGFAARPRSKVAPTLLGEQIKVERDWDIPFVKPDLSDWRPWHLAYRDVVSQTHTIPQAELDLVVGAFSSDIIKGLDSVALSQIQPITTHAAINGIDGVRFIDKINFNTSMGEPYCKSKKFFAQSCLMEGQKEAKTFAPEIVEEVARIEQLYSDGVRACPVFSGQLKDEPRHRDKVAEGKVRVFSGAPVAWSIVVRKYTLGFVKTMQENQELFEAAPGCVVQSLEWERFREFLTHFGDDQIVAGDYGKFDKKMSPVVIRSAFEVMVKVMKAAGWSEDELIPIRAMAEDVSFPYVNMGGELVMFTGSNPSGHPLTVIINSLANCIYMRLMYLRLNPKREVFTFKKHVHLLTYGDDNIMGVNKAIPWFNHTAIMTALAGIGVEYTMADKKTRSVPYVNIGDVGFLKRGWIWLPEVGAYAAPLEKESIHKMLCVGVKSRTLGDEAHMAAVMVSAVNEWFYHGRSKFESERAWIVQKATEAGILEELEAAKLPTWDELVKRFWKASRGIYTDRLGVFEQLPSFVPK